MPARPTRLWWHLDDVLPGEHALAAREHRITRVHPDPTGRHAIGAYLWPGSVVEQLAEVIL